MATNYGDTSIDLLEGAERIRTRPASMLGSSGLAGARHGFIEMYGNSLDERTSGYGDRLDVIYHEDGSMSLRDYGRGVPIGWNERRKHWNWHIIYNELYGGGKYDNGQWYLASIDKESIWTRGTEKYKKVVVTLAREFGFDVEDLEIGKIYTFRDLDVRRIDADTLGLKVNNMTWMAVTWEMLNKRLNYLASVGLNGLGAASTQYTSEYFVVKSFRDGKCTSRSFRRGIPLVNDKPFNVFQATQEEIMAIPEEVSDTDEQNGTFIHWKPDDTVFDDVNIGGDWLYETCKDISDVAGIDLYFENKQTGFSETIKAGNIESLTEKHCGKALVMNNDAPAIMLNNRMEHGNIRVEGDDFVYIIKCDVAIALTEGYTKNSCYHNSVKMQSGVQYEAIDSAISVFMAEKAKARGVKLEASDYENCFGVFVSSYSNYASFRNQTKDAVDDTFIYNIIFNTIIEKLKIEYGKGNRALLDVIEKVIKEAEIRIATREYAKIKRDADKVKREKAPEKFVSCEAYENKRYDEAELWITEGDSAKSSVKDARDKRFQAIYPIRGKGLNVLKANIKRILSNKEIREIFSLIGTGFELNIRGQKTFNIEDLKFNKIIFATDADEDGYQIRVLLFLIFYRLAPELIRNGHIYIAETPRFRIDLTGGEYVYALNDAERDAYLKQYSGRIRKVSRYKGLGEVNEDVLRETTVAPETRKLIQLNCDLMNETERELIDALFGVDKYKQRKEILATVLGMEISDLLEDEALKILSDEDEEEDDSDVQLIEV